MSYDFNAAEVFKIAVQIEKNGKKFYEHGIQVVDDAGIKKLFAELASQETEHQKKFESLLAALPPEASRPTVWDPENEVEQYLQMMAGMHVFVKADMDADLAQVKDVFSAIKMAMEFEKDSVIFFLTMRDATPGKKEQELVYSLVKEEQEHLRRLTMELKRLKRK